MSKHFLLNPNIELQDKEVINSLRQDREVIFNDTFAKRRKEDIELLSKEDNLTHVGGKVVVKVDIDGKDSWVFESGERIEYRRRFNNFNKRQTEPVNAIVISGEGMQKGAEILIDHKAIHDSARIFDYKDDNSTVQYYSIQNEMCFAWHDGNEWQPLRGFDFAFRVFKPYEGIVTGIEPTIMKDTLFVTSGELKNKAVKTLVACDYEIIFQGRNGREQSLIRFRPMGDEKTKREPEAIAILETETKLVMKGKLLVGYSIKDAKKYERTRKDKRAREGKFLFEK
jgi:hypothetical protein